ncbi:hypothetical protein Acr_26g0003030 [Actinidia rufa]|uniref:Uncharacterized protein n=1 Tax=Actinidia rufa TaxID=165716 RepID=A0A7J0H1R5_9ERIC|nr:hypothetical protein Acr_26g0003030 [Actinidia rufa]
MVPAVAVGGWVSDRRWQRRSLVPKRLHRDSLKEIGVIYCSCYGLAWFLSAAVEFKRRNQPTLRDFGTSVASDDKNKLNCDYCQRPCHTREPCWHIHGRPPIKGRGGGRSGNSRAHHSTLVKPPPSSSESMTLSTSKIELICSVMLRLDTSAVVSSSFAHSGNFV